MPPPTSTTPAFSPGPQITQGASVGSVWTASDLGGFVGAMLAPHDRERCRVRCWTDGGRSRMLQNQRFVLILGVRPCSAISSGVMADRVRDRSCERLHQRIEHRRTVGSAVLQVGGAFGMGHHAEYVSTVEPKIPAMSRADPSSHWPLSRVIAKSDPVRRPSSRFSVIVIGRRKLPS